MGGFTLSLCMLRNTLTRAGCLLGTRSAAIPSISTSFRAITTHNGQHKSFWRSSPLSVANHQQAAPTRGIEEFFDDQLKTNIEEFSKSNGQVAAKPVMTGKPWSTVDLKKKSFDDLHKLWFVLLKERNLLITESLRLKTQPELIKEFRLNTRQKKVRKSMARIKGLLELRKHEYHRYLGLKTLKEMKDAGEPIPREARKKLLVPCNLNEEQKYKRRLRTFTMTYKNRYKHQLLKKLQHESNKLGKRFDQRPRISEQALEEISIKAKAKAERRMERDAVRQASKDQKEEEINEIIREQAAQ